MNTALSREIIGVDIDDVLSQSAQGFSDYSNSRWGPGHSAEEYTEEWAAFWNVSLEEALARADEVHSAGVFGGYKHHQEAVPVLAELALRRDLVVITSRRNVIKPETDIWLDQHFPGLFKDVYYAGIWDSDAHVQHQLKQTKAELCRELGVDYLIDDQLKHCFAAAQLGVIALLFGDYKWNEAEQLPDNTIRVRDWAAVKQYFDDHDRALSQE